MRRSSLAALAPFLSREAGRPVIDKTELTGMLDIDVKWSPETVSDFVDDSLIPHVRTEGSFFTAVREQLGLKLEPTNAEIEVIAIQRIERPTPN